MLHLEWGNLVIDLRQLSFTSVKGGWKGMSCAWPCLSVSRILRVSNYMKGEKQQYLKGVKQQNVLHLGFNDHL